MTLKHTFSPPELNGGTCWQKLTYICIDPIHNHHATIKNWIYLYFWWQNRTVAVADADLTFFICSSHINKIQNILAFYFQNCITAFASFDLDGLIYSFQTTLIRFEIYSHLLFQNWTLGLAEFDLDILSSF